MSLARRGTDKYGGLNICLAKVLDQEIAFHTDPTNTAARMAWAELSGLLNRYGFRFWHQLPATFFDDEKQDAGGQICLRLAVIVGSAFEAGEITADAVVQAFDGEGVGFALNMVFLAEDSGVGMPEVGGEDDVWGMRKLRIQPLRCFGATIPQRPAQDAFGSTINSPPEPAISFFLAIYVHNSSASTHSTFSAGVAFRTLPDTAFFTQLVMELWLTPNRRSVARWPTPSKYCAKAAAFFSGATKRRSVSPKVFLHCWHRQRWWPCREFPFLTGLAV